MLSARCLQRRRFQISPGKAGVVPRELVRQGQRGLRAVGWVSAFSAPSPALFRGAGDCPPNALGDPGGSTCALAEAWVRPPSLTSTVQIQAAARNPDRPPRRCLRTTQGPGGNTGGSACLISSLPVLLQETDFHSSSSLHSAAPDGTNPPTDRRKQSPSKYALVGLSVASFA